MERTYRAFRIDKVVPLRDKDYYWYLLEKIRKARKRIWASIFLIDLHRARDVKLAVRAIVNELAHAKRRGVDVRILTGTSEQIPAIRELAMISRMFLRTRHIPVRWHAPLGKAGTHDKYVIIDDDLLILGSHNWIHDSFNESAEDSVAVYSRDLTNTLERQFATSWTARASLAKKAKSET